jgi:2-acylglycerol O-acyltransferase 2
MSQSSGFSLALACWFSMWGASGGLVLSALFFDWARVVMLIWVIVSFILAPPREWPAFRRFIQKHLGRDACDFFPLSVHADEFRQGMQEYKESTGLPHLDVLKNHRPPLLFNFAPHGVLSIHVNFLINISGLWSKEKLPEIRTLVGTGFFFLPFAREYQTWMGTLAVSSSQVREAFSKKLDLGLVPGGFEEAVLAHPGTNELYLLENLGWVKHAIRGGYGVVPVFAFGETELIPQWRGYKLQRARFAGKTRIPMICPKRLLPKSHPVSLVLGAPVWFPHVKDPTKAQLRECHGRYIEAVRALYEKHKAKFGAADIPLVIH